MLKFLTCFIILISYSNSELILEKVLLLSRHNVRTPLSKSLPQTSPRQWPSWREKSGYLTSKGRLLEGYMGEFFSEWLQQKGLIQNQCPSDDTLYVYANTAQRTVASAEAFVTKGYSDCNITVHHSDRADPIFSPFIHNSTFKFRQEALNQMKDYLNSLHLNTSYTTIENILDYKNSPLCKQEGLCDMLTDENRPMVITGKKPFISGPLKLSKSVVDSFIMEYYEGFPSNEVAWGQIKSEDEWSTILNLSRAYLNAIFTIKLISLDLSKPLLGYLSSFLLNDNSPKVVLLMGHDANIYTVLSAMNFKPHVLHGQYEAVPAGGKIVFQKWFNMLNGSYHMKIEYVYQTADKMRNGVKLSLDEPPEFTTLELKACIVDKDGYCPWNEFKTLLEELIA